MQRTATSSSTARRGSFSARGTERHLEPKAFELLELLLDQRPQAVAKAEIHERLWPNTFVSESSVTGLVVQIRQPLGDDSRQPRFVRTVHGFGYAFSGEAFAESASQSRKGSGGPRLIWEKRAFSLEPGENIVGRDEDLTVCIDAPAFGSILVHSPGC